MTRGNVLRGSALLPLLAVSTAALGAGGELYAGQLASSGSAASLQGALAKVAAARPGQRQRVRRSRD